MRATPEKLAWVVVIALAVGAGLDFRPAQIAAAVLAVAWLLGVALPWLIIEIKWEVRARRRR